MLFAAWTHIGALESIHTDLIKHNLVKLRDRHVHCVLWSQREEEESVWNEGGPI